MRIGIAGAGRTGCSLALALASAGACIAGVYSRRPEAASAVFGGTGIACQDDMRSLVENSDLVFLAVPDSIIAPFAVETADLCGDAVAGKVFLHLSGALTSEELKGLADRGAITGSLHPIQTFPDRKNSWQSMYGICFGFEGRDGALTAARKIVGLLSGDMLVLNPGTKPLYHAAACMLSNYTVALSHAAAGLLERAGIPGDVGMKAFGPLLKNTAENIVSSGSVNALTGPIARGDAGTVAGHLSAIGDDEGGTAEIYRTMGKLTVKLALLKGSIDGRQAEDILRVLNI